MEEKIELLIEKADALGLLASSLLLLLIGIVILLSRKRFSFERRLLIFSGFALGATWCLRFLVGISGALENHTLTALEEIINSVIHSLQSFSMDEDYTDYIIKGKFVFSELFGDESFMPVFYGVYVSLLNIICPVAGGAILCTILSSIFPRLKLWFMSLCFLKPICYFSELNDRSLALAESIRNSEGSLKRSLIVFTDVYPDGDDEEVSERIQKAKLLGAVCIRDDISTITISKRAKKKFFLIDTAEIGNLQALSDFTEKKKYSRLTKDDEIYLFCQSDSNVLIEEKVRRILKEELGEGNAPSIIPVKGYRNLVCNLLRYVPLYEALDRKSGKKTLSVTIFGSGAIGTEMFLNTYWCGQILDYRLRINMLSIEKESDFRSRIDHINPEIFKTADPDSDLLRIYGTGEEKAPVYFEFRYIETDVRKDDLYTKITKESDGVRLVDSDYFLVALGSDEDNLEVADLIGRYVTIDKAGAGGEVPVAYVIYDDELAKTLTHDPDDFSAVKMHPFGSLSETYAYKNIVFEGIRDEAQRIADDYSREVNHSAADSKKLSSDQYSYWANLTRAIHAKYKAFSAGMDDSEYYGEIKKCNKKMVDAKMEFSAYYKKNMDGKDIITCHRLAWLEHRRWNAFMRSVGFRCPTPEEERGYIMRLPDDKNKVGLNSGKHKNVRLKLHPCLVECDENGMKKDPASGGVRTDLLDDTYIRFSKSYVSKNFGVTDFKEFDYPRYDCSQTPEDSKADSK